MLLFIYVLFLALVGLCTGASAPEAESSSVSLLSSAKFQNPATEAISSIQQQQEYEACRHPWGEHEFICHALKGHVCSPWGCIVPNAADPCAACSSFRFRCQRMTELVTEDPKVGKDCFSFICYGTYHENYMHEKFWHPFHQCKAGGKCDTGPNTCRKTFKEAMTDNLFEGMRLTMEANNASSTRNITGKLPMDEKEVSFEIPAEYWELPGENVDPFTVNTLPPITQTYFPTNYTTVSILTTTVPRYPLQITINATLHATSTAPGRRPFNNQIPRALPTTSSTPTATPIPIVPPSNPDLADDPETGNTANDVLGAVHPGPNGKKICEYWGKRLKPSYRDEFNSTTHICTKWGVVWAPTSNLDCQFCVDWLNNCNKEIWNEWDQEKRCKRALCDNPLRSPDLCHNDKMCNKAIGGYCRLHPITVVPPKPEREEPTLPSEMTETEVTQTSVYATVTESAGSVPAKVTKGVVVNPAKPTESVVYAPSEGFELA